MAAKCLFQNQNEQEDKPMFAVRNILPLLLVALLCSLSFGATFRTVKQGGGGTYTMIQDALDDSGESDVNGIIEVQDNSVYTENLTFPSDPCVNFLTLRARDGNSPTIRLSGSAAETNYIDIKVVGTTIQGFKIDFSGDSYLTVNNSFLIHAGGGASTVRDCNIVGPTAGYMRGIAGVATIEDVELSNCTIGILCDANYTNTGFRYSISGCHIYEHRLWGVLLSDSNVVMDDCLIERCGGELTVGGNILANGNDGTLDLLITNSIIREAIMGRNFNMEDTGTATINDSIIMNALGTLTHSDEILQYRGTLNLNRCIIRAEKMRCVNFASPTSGSSVGVCNINHCDLRKVPSTNDDWAITTTNSDANLTIRNSIVTGSNGYLRNSGTFTSNWNDNFCTNRIGAGGSVVLGPNDLSPGVDPFYIQTSNPNEPNFFALQPYSLLIHADEDGNYMGSQGVLTGQESWPADLGGGHGVDFKDFAILALHWRDSNTIPAIAQLLLDDFESYSATGGSGQVGTLLGPNGAGGPDSWRVLNWTYSPWILRSSTLSLLTDANDANSPTKAMRWVYDVNTLDSETNEVRFTEILVMLDNNNVDFGLYNEIRLSLKRDANNSPDLQTFMYVKFLDDIYGTYETDGGTDPTGPDKYDIANSINGGSTSTNPGMYYDWTINLDNLVGYTWGHTNLSHVVALIFGIRTQAVGPYGLGRGTIYVDDMRLIDRPGCSAPVVGDLDNDCNVDFQDVDIFAFFWLMGK